MLEIIRTTLLAGLGAGVITKERAEEAVQGLVEQGKLTREEARQLVHELLQSGSQQWDDMQAGVSDSLRKTLDAADVARASEFQKLARAVENLQHRVAMLEDSLERNRKPDTSP